MDEKDLCSDTRDQDKGFVGGGIVVFIHQMRGKGDFILVFLSTQYKL